MRIIRRYARGRKYVEALYSRLTLHDSPFEIRSQQRLGVMVLPPLVKALSKHAFIVLDV